MIRKGCPVRSRCAACCGLFWSAWPRPGDLGKRGAFYGPTPGGLLSWERGWGLTGSLFLVALCVSAGADLNKKWGKKTCSVVAGGGHRGYHSEPKHNGRFYINIQYKISLYLRTDCWVGEVNRLFVSSQ